MLTAATGGEQYFARRPTSARAERELRADLRGRSLRFITDAGVFSRRAIDRGTRLLIESLDLAEGETVLDLGCGYGPIGIAAATVLTTGRVFMVDVNERACELAARNAELNGAVNVEVRSGDGFAPVAGLAFDVIVCNPPIRAGKAVVYRLIEQARDHLKPGGRLVMVAQTKQGARSLLAKMADVFPRAREIAKAGGYRVMQSETDRDT